MQLLEDKAPEYGVLRAPGASRYEAHRPTASREAARDQLSAQHAAQSKQAKSLPSTFPSKRPLCTLLKQLPEGEHSKVTGI